MLPPTKGPSSTIHHYTLLVRRLLIFLWELPNVALQLLPFQRSVPFLSRVSAMTHVALLREEVALTNLKQQLGATEASIATVSNPPPDAIDEFLLRYLRQCNFNVGRTVFALQQRREYERNLTGVTVTPHVVMSLKSGAFTIIGEDVLHRPVLHIRMTHYRPPSGGGDAGLGAGVDGHGLDSSSVDSDRLFIVLLEYLHALALKHHSSLSLGGAAVVGGRQECAVLVTGGDSGGVFSQRRAGMISKLTSLAVKYYPGLIGSVLVVDANWISRQGIKATAAVKGASERLSSNRNVDFDNNTSRSRLIRGAADGDESGEFGAQSMKDIVKIVRTEQLPRHMDPATVIPRGSRGSQTNAQCWPLAPHQMRRGDQPHRLLSARPAPLVQRDRYLGQRGEPHIEQPPPLMATASGTAIRNQPDCQFRYFSILVPRRSHWPAGSRVRGE